MLLRLSILIILLTGNPTGKDKFGFTRIKKPTEISREDIMKWYKAEYLASDTKGYQWNGNMETCNEGSLPADVQAKVLKRINYFRKMAGLTSVTFEDSLSAKAQKAAFMMKANNSLSHMPPKTWKCYSDGGAFAASHSDLSYGDNNSGSITGFIKDSGEGNNETGHRRWILYSQAKVMGHGATDMSDALWVVPPVWTKPAKYEKFIAWPCQGFMPAHLVFPRWSFAYQDADFTNAKVTMTGPDGGNVALKVEVMSGNGNIVGDRAIVWVPENIKLDSPKDIVYTVNIRNVKIGEELKDFTYKVTLIQIP